MTSTQLVLQRGAIAVTEDRLLRYEAPPPSGRWYPLSHSRVLSLVRSLLVAEGYTIQRLQLGVLYDGARFFAALDLGTALTEGTTLAVGFRNSYDKSLCLGFYAGARVLCCDNLAFHSELLVKRKHTRRGEEGFASAIAQAVTRLDSFQKLEAQRIERMQATLLGEDLADALILRAFEKRLISGPQLPRVLKEWRQPSFEAFRPRTLWSLVNAFTTALADRAEKQPAHFATQTMRLGAFLDPSEPPFRSPSAK